MKIHTDIFNMLIGGEIVGSENTFKAINPATESVIAEAPDATEQQLNNAVRAARDSQPHWAMLSEEKRKEALITAADKLTSHQEALAELLSLEQGKPLASARHEIVNAANYCTETCQLSLPTRTIEDSDKRLVQCQHVPLGVVAAIVPWNFPVTLAFWKIVPALLAGNTIVLKPSPFTSLTTLKIGELLKDTFPPGVFNVISGGDHLGPLISSHPNIDKISFTGSTATGRRVMASSAHNLKRLTLELGGNDAAIVMPDVDINSVVRQLFWGCFANSSQLCLAVKRLYVHGDIYETFRDAFVDYAMKVKVGPGTDPSSKLGPIQNALQFERVCELLDDSLQQGHRFALGGSVDRHKRGYFFPITIIDNPSDNSRVVVEEAFGPILPLLKFYDTDDVIQRANNSEFGLSASVWCKDSETAKNISRRLAVGTVWINEIHYMSSRMPMSGHKQSGLGVEHGIEGLLEYTELKTFCFRK